MPIQPFPFGTCRFFDDAQSALLFVKEIYVAHISYLREAFEGYVSGQVPVRRIEAGYPYIAIDVVGAAARDTRLSYGFVSEPGRYSTTITRPDIFDAYLQTQLDLLLRNHGGRIEVGVSNTPVPLHFAFYNGLHVEGALSPERVAMLPLFFSVPNLAAMDEGVANGFGLAPESGDRPLSLFSAPRVDYSLQRLRHYTGTDAHHFQSFVIFTNYQFYVDEFVRQGRELIAQGAQGYTSLEEPTLLKRSNGFSALPQMPAYHLKRADGRGITMVNIGVGPSNARNISDHIAVLRPEAWLMLGHCAGLRSTQKLGDYVLAHGYVRDDKALDEELPLWVPVPALAEVQRALEGAVANVTGLAGYDLKSVMRTGTVVTTGNRNWEISGYQKLVERFCQSRAIALDMESAVIAANGFRFRVPYGTLLCVSDRPFHGEIKLPGMATDFYQRQVDQHLTIGLRAIDALRESGHETLHSRKLRSFAEVAFR